MKHLYYGIVSFVLLLSISGCGEKRSCTPHSSKYCTEGVTYWVDSCGDIVETFENCECGCNSDHSGCEQCACTPECSGKVCGPDGCGGTCPPGCSGQDTCNDLGICGKWCIIGDVRCTDDGFGFESCGPDQNFPGYYTYGNRIPCSPTEECLNDTQLCSRSSCLETEIIFVLDRSSSMLTNATWEWLKPSFIESITGWDKTNLFGFRQFPTTDCSVGAVIPMSKDNLDTIISSIEDPSTDSSTPIKASLEGLARHYGDPLDGQAVVLITDGDETCSTQEVAIDEAAVLWRAGVRVYAISVSTVANKSLLDRIAKAGGTFDSISVFDNTDMNKSLNEIFNKLNACDCITTCLGRECGPDPACGRSCGDCEPNVQCNSVGQCMESSWYDHISNLTWENTQVSELLVWQDASNYCEGLKLDGFEDWRLPTVDEMRTLVRGCASTSINGSCSAHDSCTDDCCWDDTCLGCTESGGPGENGCYWPVELRGVCDKDFWTSNYCSDNPDTRYDVDFRTAMIGRYSMVTNTKKARCVRAGK